MARRDEVRRPRHGAPHGEKYGLTESEEEKIAAILVDVEIKRRETEESFDFEEVDPVVFEARWRTSTTGPTSTCAKAWATGCGPWSTTRTTSSVP